MALSQSTLNRISALSIDYANKYRVSDTLEAKLNFNSALTLLSIAANMGSDNAASPVVSQAISLARSRLVNNFKIE